MEKTDMFQTEKEWYSKSDEIVDLFSELLESDNIVKDDEIIFSEKSKSLISKLSLISKETNTYKKAAESNKIPVFLEKTKAADILAELLFKVNSSPTKMHAIASVIIYIPIIDEKLSS